MIWVSVAACVRLNCVTNWPVPSQLRDSAGAILELHRALELAPDDVKYRVLRAAAYRQEVCQPVCPGSSQFVWLTFGVVSGKLCRLIARHRVRDQILEYTMSPTLAVARMLTLWLRGFVLLGVGVLLEPSAIS